MCGMTRLTVLLPIAALLLTGCPADTSKQWYKPNVDYTAADFNRDSAACTDKKTKVLDEECMKQRGWLALGADIGPAVKAPSTPPKGAGKY